MARQYCVKQLGGQVPRYCRMLQLEQEVALGTNIHNLCNQRDHTAVSENQSERIIDGKNNEYIPQALEPIS